MKTFFWYDLETSGLSSRFDRIMQFAGIRTDENFKQIGESVNILIKLTDDILPSPEALLVTKITPQATLQDGLTEAEFAKFFLDEIATPDTIIVGYNNVRFDDEFIRNFLWRNFRDPYEWSWSEGRSRWDLLDVVRLVRALRPDGINWPFKKVSICHPELVSGSNSNNKTEILKQVQNDNAKVRNNKEILIPTNTLEALARDNGFENKNAHDALADVQALINVAKLIKDKQPKMFDYLLKMRNKKEVMKLVNLENPAPFVYASGRYSAEFEKTTVAFPVAPATKQGAVLVWDLRVSPDDFANLSEKEILAKITADWSTRSQKDFVPLPVKELTYNKCPAVAPLNTLDESAQKRLHLDLSDIKKNLASLQNNRGLLDKISAAFATKNTHFVATNNNTVIASDAKQSPANQQKSTASPDVESKLYNSFTPAEDKIKVRAVASANANDLADFHPTFIDERLPELLLRYKARNFAKSLTADEKTLYEDWRSAKILREIPAFMQKLAWLAAIGRGEEPQKLSDDDQKQFSTLKSRIPREKVNEFVLEELQLWAESIIPTEY
ncbi:MAG: exodeoxyribonuclease I [Candidatus Nomurabacteria bacterium]|jgi:exodeoxyribonuclease-1|nr:exodeoxyribonuclease I [Candidatus Nomurabacteria bacterium]